MKDNAFENGLTEKQKRIFGIISIAALVLFIAFLCVFIGRPMIEFVSEPEKFRDWVYEKGIAGKIIFVGMVVFQVVVAIIPGEPLEIGAGYAFGSVQGTLLTIIGIALGSAVIFLLVKTLGIKIIEVFFSSEKIKSLKFLQNSKRLNLITFIIFFVPGTPKDLLSYFIGLTDMKFSTWMIIASLARIPSVVTSTVGGNALGEEKYKSAIIIFIIAILISLCGILIYRLICKYHNK